MAQPQAAKPSFKAPEGRYVQHSERGTACSFAPTRPLRLTFATVQHQGSAHSYVIYNVLDTLAFCHYSTIDRVPLRQIVVGNGGSGQLIYPTCHDHHPSPDNLDLVVGLNTGDVVVGSVKAQLQAISSNTKLLDLLHFNPEGSIDPSRVVAVAWVPGTNASLFAAAHQSGSIYLYQPQAGGGATESSPRSSKAGAAAPRPSLTVAVCAGGLTSMAVSPDGNLLASTSKDGVLYVNDLHTGQLSAGFKSHYGGLTCCTWSHDSHYIATGGEDDLVCVFGLAEQAVVFWGEGHTSWVTQVAFDRWESETSTSGTDSLQSPKAQAQQTRYRLASVGQDCQLLLWDFTVEEGDFRDSLELLRLSSRPEKQDTYPGAIHRRTPSNSNANGGHVPAEAALSGSGDFAARLARGTTAPLPPEVSLPVRRAEMLFSTPIMAQMIHPEPCSDILFMKEAVYTGCYCGQIRCWRRPERAQPGEAAARPQPPRSPDADRSGDSVVDSTD